MPAGDSTGVTSAIWSARAVNGLGLAWYLDIPGAMGVVAEPIVVDGVIYVSAPQSIVYAVDAASGKVIWKLLLAAALTVLPLGSDGRRGELRPR